jgi:ribose 1,5-bisphosphokinase PhnN
MANLFLIDGASGSGKTDMLEYLFEEHSKQAGLYLTVVKKFSTREERLSVEGKPRLDLELIDQAHFVELERQPGFYTYEYGSARYGFFGARVEEALKTHLNVFLIVRSHPIIKALRVDFKDATIVPILIYSDREYIRKRFEAEKEQLLKLGHSEKALEQGYQARLQRSEVVWREYIRDPLLYREIIINSFSKEDFWGIIERLLDKYSRPG